MGPEQFSAEAESPANRAADKGITSTQSEKLPSTDW